MFLNADKAFDTNELRCACAARGIEVNIARNRRAVEWQTTRPYAPNSTTANWSLSRCNVWLDRFKGLIVRYKTCLEN